MVVWPGYEFAFTISKGICLHAHLYCDFPTRPKFVFCPVRSTASRLLAGGAQKNAFDSRDSNNGDVSGGLSYVGGVAGSAFRFDGSTGAVTLTSPTNLAALQDFTIETWLRRRSTTLATFNSPADGHGTSGGLEYMATARSLILSDSRAK